LEDGTRYTDAPNAKDRGAWRVVLKHAPGKTEAQAREIMKTWAKKAVLENREYDNPVSRTPAQGLCLDTTKRPG
jgi:hypothetical protein